MSSLQIRRLRIEIEKLQWLHQQELAEMKHNLGESPAAEPLAGLRPGPDAYRATVDYSWLESGRAQS